MDTPDDVDFGFMQDQIAFQIHIAGRALRSSVRLPDGRGLKPTGWYTALVLIGFNPGMSQKQLAEVLLLDPSVVVGIVDDLARDGLATRTRSTLDRRRMELRLSVKGEAELVRLYHASEAREAVLRDNLNDGEREQLIALLGKVRSAASHIATKSEPVTAGVAV